MNAINQTVGNWKLSSEASRNFLISSTCPQAIVHAHAEEKPYYSQFVFVAPPAGTGPITFRALFKFGSANNGAFYYPAVDLILAEGTAIAHLSSFTSQPSQTVNTFDILRSHDKNLVTIS